MEAIVHLAELLHEVTADSEDQSLCEETSTFAESVITEATSVTALLADSRFGRFEATSAALRFAVSGKVRTLRDIRKCTNRRSPQLRPRRSTRWTISSNSSLLPVNI